MAFRKVTCKLGSMRKVQDFVVYPRKDAATEVIIQSESRIARITLATGEGILSKNRKGAAFVDLMIGVEKITMPSDVLAVLQAPDVKVPGVPEGTISIFG